MSDTSSERNTYELIGRVTVGWNDIELTWMALFVTFLDAPRVQADAVYHSLKVFAAQRDMARDAGEVVLQNDAALITELRKLHRVTGKAAGHRNAVAHAKYIHGSPRDTTLYIWDVGRNRLIDKDLDAELEVIVSDFEKLDEDVNDFLFKVCAYLGKEPPSFETTPRPNPRTGSEKSSGRPKQGREGPRPPRSSPG